MKMARDDDDDDNDRFRRCQSASTKTSPEMHGSHEYENTAVSSVSALCTATVPANNSL